MDTSRGFSLTEVLISLILLTGTSLALLKQQWQTHQLFNHLHLKNLALVEQDNTAERVLWDWFN